MNTDAPARTSPDADPSALYDLHDLQGAFSEIPPAPPEAPAPIRAFRRSPPPAEALAEAPARRLELLIGAGRLVEAAVLCRRLLGQTASPERGCRLPQGEAEGLAQARLRLCLGQLLREQAAGCRDQARAVDLRAAAEREVQAAIWLIGLEEDRRDGLRERALYEAGLLRWLAGAGEAAIPLARQALARARGLSPEARGDLATLCTALLARIAQASGRYDRAARQLREAIPLAATAGERALLWRNLAAVEEDRRRYPVAIQAMEAAIEEAERPEARAEGWQGAPLRAGLARLIGARAA